ncbi:hypothetical protein Dsin_012897 [Dipteronia sinensis]|uniref:RNase H type-1 domain-containing protein n=1 Tax=Dipteronia sinensis TaxID=43782 RepID=A0AAE0AIZ4_9ROSI|nr:hypothetical protein Dsin_012897 [Dipteronia sinensis]
MPDDRPCPKSVHIVEGSWSFYILIDKKESPVTFDWLVETMGLQVEAPVPERTYDFSEVENISNYVESGEEYGLLEACRSPSSSESEWGHFWKSGMLRGESSNLKSKGKSCSGLNESLPGKGLQKFYEANSSPSNPQGSPTRNGTDDVVLTGSNHISNGMEETTHGVQIEVGRDDAVTGNGNGDEVWNLEVEVAKVIEFGVALGFDFHGKEIEIGEVIAQMENEDLRRLARDVDRVISKLGGSWLTRGMGEDAEGASGVPCCLSDHNPIVISESGEIGEPPPFWFLNWWLEEKYMMNDAMRGWSNCAVTGSKGFLLFSKAKAAKARLMNGIKARKLTATKPQELEMKLEAVDSKAVLEGWLRKKMNVIIGESQMAFVKDRQIIDIFVLEEEIIHKWKNEKEGGELQAQFGLEKGLRQGDPLSPFLFNIVVEGLNCLLKKAANMGLMEDDTILFIKPRMDYLLNAKRLLRCFELVSGLKGFPLGGKPGCKMFWNSLVDKIEKRLAPWKRKFLSKGGRLVLIKTFISSMPTYFLSVFKISVGVALRIGKLQRDFLLGNGVLKRKIHTIRRHFPDSIAWTANSKGLFSVGSFRRALEYTGYHNSKVNEWLEGWMGLCPAFKSERVWCSLFYAIVWTIWEARNHLVFEGKVPNVEHVADLVRFRIVWWFKHLGRGSQDLVQSLLLNIKDLCVESNKINDKRIKDWIPRDKDKLKFNVHGSVRGKPGPEGIGGVLRDSNGKVLCLFSKFMGVTDSNTAELWAIKKAVQLCTENPKLRGRDVEVVSDSKVAVS